MIGNWKRTALEGLKTTLTRGANRTDRGHEEEITRLQAKIGELVVERDFWPRPSIAERGSEAKFD